MYNRRSFLKAAGLSAGGFALAPFARARQTRTTPVQPAVGELCHGFVLLPEGSPPPEFVRYPVAERPNSVKGECPRAGARSYPSTRALADAAPFPIYGLKAPPNLALVEAVAVVQPSGRWYCTGLTFQARDSCSSTVSLWAYPEFPRPYPLWQRRGTVDGHGSEWLTKADFLPAPGIRSTLEDAAMLHWQENDMLYSVLIRPRPDFHTLQATTRWLARMS